MWSYTRFGFVFLRFRPLLTVLASASLFRNTFLSARKATESNTSGVLGANGT